MECLKLLQITAIKMCNTETKIPTYILRQRSQNRIQEVTNGVQFLPKRQKFSRIQYLL